MDKKAFEFEAEYDKTAIEQIIGSYIADKYGLHARFERIGMTSEWTPDGVKVIVSADQKHQR